LDYCAENKQPKVMTLKPTLPGPDSLSLPKQQGKPIDQLIQEELEKQLSQSVIKLQKEMTETVKQMVEEQTKDF
jgi:hypothetical protein